MEPTALAALVGAQRAFFATHATRDLAFRLAALERLERAVLAYEGRLSEAMHQDFRKGPFEAYLTEISMVLSELRLQRKHLRSWAKPRRVPDVLINFPSSSQLIREPYGIALIIAPWNYPFQLLFIPLVGAIAAGNCVVLKPAEYTGHTSAVMADLIRETFPPEHVALVEGGRSVNTALLEERYDLIFFTGSPALGRIVMEKAARHLTPVCLELGGKSPCIVDVDANLAVAARRIAWGKFLNGGQTCVAPDYLMVHEEVKDALVEQLKKAVRAMYGEDPQRSPDLPRIINVKQMEHLKRLMAGCKIVFGGQVDDADRYIAPTLLEGVGPDDPIMQEEIFGPLLPMLTFKDISEVEEYVNARPKPLAFYYFYGSRSSQDRLLARTSSGGASINDVIIHVANHHLPFGGVGNSGMGGYHGEHSFEAFSHRRSVVRKPTWIDVPLRYAPYLGKLGLLKRLI